MGLCSLLPSLVLRKPVMVAWSTPGAAVLATAGVAGGFSMGEAVGAFMVCSVLVVFVGATGLLERVADRIPSEIASALLAGVLTRFGIQTFAALQTALPLVLLMVGSYLVARRLLPRYAVVITLAAAIAWVAASGQVAWSMGPMQLAMPVFVAPQWSVAAAVSLAIPLFVVTMASQNLPGIAVIKASGYELPVSKLITLTGVVSLLLAPFGAFALNFSAITAAICMGPEAHEDRKRRYTAAASCGALYLVIGLFGAVVTGGADFLPQGTCGGYCRDCPVEHDWQWAGVFVKERDPQRGCVDYVSGHAQRRYLDGDRFCLLGCGRRQLCAICATVWAFHLKRDGFVNCPWGSCLVV
jgi:benzoate membrane transport protein